MENDLGLRDGGWVVRRVVHHTEHDTDTVHHHHPGHSLQGLVTWNQERLLNISIDKRKVYL